MTTPPSPSVARNAPCPCGSGRKYKKCCLVDVETERRRALFDKRRLERLLQDGYIASEAGRRAQACALWSELWEAVRGRLQPAMTTCSDADRVFAASQFFGNWVQDYAQELYNAALDDPRHADVGVRLCQDLLAQFTDEGPSFMSWVRADLGEFHVLAGRPAEGQAIFEQIIGDEPRSALGYVRLADLLQRDGDSGRERARRLLQQAVGLPNAASFDVEARLAYLRG